MDVTQPCKQFRVLDALPPLLQELSAIADYPTLRDHLPRRLVHLLACRGVLIYLRIDETLQLVSGAFDEQPGWSAALLAVAHINPIPIQSQSPEARAWRELRAVATPDIQPTQVAVPLLNRHQCIGVLVAVRGCDRRKPELPLSWSDSEIVQLESISGVVALLLEYTRLRERDRQRIHELSLLNSISSQLHNAMYESERLHSIVIQRTREMCDADLCNLLVPTISHDILSDTASSDEEAATSAWITAELHTFLFRWYHTRRSLTPLVIERPARLNEPDHTACLELLPPTIKTFFAIPLLSSATTSAHSLGTTRDAGDTSCVLGIIVGGYTRSRKLRQTELTLLQVLASQTSSVLENQRLLEEVIEARNEARRLLRQVLDDRHQKEVILESIPSGLITTDNEGRINTFNRAAATILGYHPYEVFGLPLHKFVRLPAHPNHEGTTALQPYQPGDAREPDTAVQIQHFSVLINDRFERERMLEIDQLPLYGEQGERIGTLTTFNDMTAVHHLEEEKRRLDRLASLGEMAANVAHEVRNPLACIKTSIQMLRDDLTENTVSPETPPLSAEMDRAWVQESIDIVLKEVERLDTIVHDLLLFARPRQLHRASCQLTELCDQVLALLHKQCTDAQVDIHRSYEAIPIVWIDIAQMEQVLLNLCMNALQAMLDGGILTITCRLCTTAPSNTPGSGLSLYTRHPHQTNKHGSWLELSISDTGAGITADQLEKVFQPFYTTRAHGIGLGLPITRRLIEDHGGHMHINSQPGYGTTVRIQLPVEYPQELEHTEKKNTENTKEHIHADGEGEER